MKQAMIFAAGLGTRLKPLTDIMPKALVPVGDKELILHVIDRLFDCGFCDFVVNVHHFADMIEEQLAPQIPYNAMTVLYSDERGKLLETGGGVKHALPLLDKGERFLMHNCDILSNVDVNTFWEEGAKHDATLLVSDRDTQRYLLFDDDMRLVGWTNIKTGEVRGRMGARRYAFAGIHQMTTHLAHEMDTWPERFSIIDFYLDVCTKYDIRGYIQPDLRLMDVGKLDTLDQANEFITTI